MENFIKYTWIVLVFTGFFGIIFNLPFDLWGQAYQDEVHRLQLTPLRRIDATNRYIEAIENGQEDTSKGIKTTPPKKYYREIPYKSVKRIGRLYIYDYSPEGYSTDKTQRKEEKKYQKPLYRRDKNNPNILHKVY